MQNVIDKVLKPKTAVKVKVPYRNEKGNLIISYDYGYILEVNISFTVSGSAVFYTVQLRKGDIITVYPDSIIPLEEGSNI